MKQFDPFPEVNSKYGSPMGRRGDNPANLQDCKRLHARRQGGGDGYDRAAHTGAARLMYGLYGAGLTVKYASFIRGPVHAQTQSRR